MEQRAVVDRFGPAPGRRPDRPPVLRNGRRDSAPRRDHLSTCRLRLDARRRSTVAVSRLAARVRIPVGPLGPLLRADDPVRAGDWLADTPDSRRVLARLAAADGHLRELLVRRRAAAAVRPPVRPRLD